jgi:hypothetical protein
MGWPTPAPAGFTGNLLDHVARFDPLGEVFGHTDHELDTRILNRAKDDYACMNVLADRVDEAFEILCARVIDRLRDYIDPLNLASSGRQPPGRVVRLLLLAAFHFAAESLYFLEQ